MMCRKDVHGVIHWAYSPTQRAWEMGYDVTYAFCNSYTAVKGTNQTVPQHGPSCLWCLQMEFK